MRDAGFRWHLPLRPSRRNAPRFFSNCLFFAHFCRYLTSGARGFSGVIRSGETPIHWPDLALFTPTGEAGNETGVASFVVTLTLALWERARESALAQRGLVSIVVASLRVARSGKLLIRFHFLPFRPISYRLRGDGMRGSRLHGNGMRGSRLHGNDGGNRCYTQTGSHPRRGTALRSAQEWQNF